MYESTFNQLIRHMRAKTPLLNMVLDCERICDSMIPGETGRNGLVELNETARQASGPPVVCFSSDSVGGLTLNADSVDMLNSEAIDVLDQFMGMYKDQSLMDILASEDSAIAPITEVYRQLVQKNRTPNLRVLLLVSDMVIESLHTRRVLLNYAKNTHTATVVLITTDAIEDPLLRTYMPVLIAERPSRGELSLVFTRALKSLVGSEDAVLHVGSDDEVIEPEKAASLCAGCLSGLHVPTAMQVLRLHLESPLCRGRTEDGKPEFRIDLSELSREKAEVLNKAGYVTLINDLVEESEVGGLGELKRWLGLRREGFTQEAQEQNLRAPRGALLVGPPGTAKSTCAKLTAHQFGMPLIRLDIGALFNSRLGNSERNMRNALSVADASAPCVLLLDEVA